MSERKPNGYWRKWDNVEAEIKVLVGKTGHFPTIKEINELVGVGMETGITRYHGGLTAVREKLGYAVKSPDWSNVDSIRALMEENKWTSLPRDDILREKGYGSIVTVIKKHYGGYPALRALLGEKPKRIADGYWKDFRNVKSELDKIIQKLGYFPTSDELTELENSLSCGISRHHKGLIAVREKLGYELKKRPNGYWKNWDNVKGEIERVKAKHGFAELPQAEELEKLGYSSLGQAILKYHGGFFKVRASLGENQKQVPIDSWKDLEYTIARAKEIMLKHGYTSLPTSRILEKLGHGSFSVAIRKYHGGCAKFRTHLGEIPIRRAMGAWKSLDFAIAEARKVMELQGFTTLPAGHTLSKLGYSALVTAIHEYHGGFPNFRELLARQSGQPSSKEQLEEILDKYSGDSS